MDKWQQEFAARVGTLREQWGRRFEAFAGQTLQPVYGDFEAFAARCELRTGNPRTQTGLRTFKFSLTEDAYVLVHFRPKGIDRIEFDYECAVPGIGRIEGVRTSATADQSTRDWVQSCFRMALDDLLTRYTEGAAARATPELVPA